MALSEASTLTYKAMAASAAASSSYVRPVLARAASRPSFPAQIALVSELSNRFRLNQPLTINFEQEEGGKIIASDDVFYMYGEGFTRQDALRDYASSLSEYYALLESHEHEPGADLFSFLQSYLQPI